MSKYNPRECHESILLYGVYLCRLNGGVPCEWYRGRGCCLERIEEALGIFAEDKEGSEE